MTKTMKLLVAVATCLCGGAALADTWYDESTGYTWTYAIEDSGGVRLDGISPSPSGAVSIPSRISGMPVTGILRTFYGCSGLMGVTIPGSVENIGLHAFSYCSNLKNVTISAGVRSVGEQAFSECRVLESVAIPDSVTNISGYAFSNCTGLKSVSIPGSMTNVDSGAFYGCSGVTSLTASFVPFGMSPGLLQTVVIPGDAVCIPDWAFQNCSGLASVTIPDSVRSIRIGAFQNCSGLTSVTIPDGVTEIKEFAFYNCSGLTRVTIPNSVTSIDFSAFVDCDSLASVAIPQCVCNGDQSVMSLFGKEITNVVVSAGVTSIARNTFDDCLNLKSVTIPGSVVSIANYAFEDCPNLRSVFFEGDAPNALGSSLFSSSARGVCRAYVHKGSNGWGVAIPGTWNGINISYVEEGLVDPVEPPLATYKVAYEPGAYGSGQSQSATKTYGKPLALAGALFSRTGYTQTGWSSNYNGYLLDYALGAEYTANAGITLYPYWTADGSAGGDGEILSETVNGLTWSYVVVNGGAEVFGGKHLEWDDEEEDYTWEYTPAIDPWTRGAVTVPSSLGGHPVTAIGDGAFTECYSITSVTVPAGVVSIGEDAFSDCGSLASVSLPAGLKSIGDDAFDGCNVLRGVVLPASLASIGERAFDDCSSLASIYIPRKVKTVGYHAFARCTALKSADVPEALKPQVSANAVFYKCSPRIAYYVSGVPSVTYEANGGKIGTQAKATLPLDGDEDAETYFYALPPDPAKGGMVFDGWWTAKAGGTRVSDGDSFAAVGARTLYAHWLKATTVTLKGVPGSDLYSAYAGESEVWGAGTVTALSGVEGGLMAPDETVDARGARLAFQKWAVSPAAADVGPDFEVGNCETPFRTPSVNVTFTPVYVDKRVCGRLHATADAAAVDVLGFEISPDDSAMQWSPDGGKTWYCVGDSALLAKGNYTVTWRSTDPQWSAPADKPKATVLANGETYVEAAGAFTFVPQVVVDIVCDEGSGEYLASSACGTATPSPKDGLAPVGKTVSLTAKANRGYAFQGWRMESPHWSPVGIWFDDSSTTYKIANKALAGTAVQSPGAHLDSYVQKDGKVHVTAFFKALSAYRKSDIAFGWLSGSDSGVEASGGSATVRAYVGCALDDYEIDFGSVAMPLTYKLAGALPPGVKFDAKNGLFTGAPTKTGLYTATVTATDPAGNAAGARISIDVSPAPAWTVGTFRAVLGEADADEIVAPNGLLELSVTSAGKASAKVLHRGGAASFSGQVKCLPYDGGDNFVFRKENKEDHLNVWLNDDGTVSGDFSVSFRNGSATEYVDGAVAGLWQDPALLAKSGLLNGYYTAGVESTGEGYGYLTLKTDAKGVAKVAGKLSDGQALSMSAPLLPFRDGRGGGAAREDLFSAPSAYKKNGFFAMTLALGADGSVSGGGGDGAGVHVRPADDGQGEAGQMDVSAFGALYSPAASLDGHYFGISCGYSDEVDLRYSYKEGKDTYYDFAAAVDFGGSLFDVVLRGDKTGAIKLAGTSPKPWAETVKYYWDDGRTRTAKEWRYDEDAKGNPITDPSQLSISFTKATGLFSGKATVYFDYDDDRGPQHMTASLPYAGVVVNSPEAGFSGWGAAIYSSKTAYGMDTPSGVKYVNYTKAVSLPVVLGMAAYGGE